VLHRVEAQATRMTVLVEDLLLLARIDAGRPLERAPVDLSAVVVESVGDAHAAGPAYHWRLELPEDPVVVPGDATRLHQVLGNLLANARTHTPAGTTVTTALSTSDGMATLTVADNGPGIPEELQPHVFQRFARGDSSRSRTAGSTGLGLSIVEAVVSAHAGRVAVTSRPGRTVFKVTLPR
jgi:two-component system OmpR family sensor kinase